MNISLSPKLVRKQIPTGILVVLLFGCMINSTNAAFFTLQEQTEEAEQENDEGEGDFLAAEMVVQGFGFGGQGVSKKYMQAAKKLDVLLQLELQIEEIKAVCDLDEANAKKLKVAAKAVAQKQVAKWTKSMDEFQLWNSAGAKDEEDEEDVDIDEIDLSKLDQNTVQWLSMHMAGLGSRNGPTTEKIWKKALKAALSEQQLEKLEVQRKQRKEKLVDSITQFYGQMYGAQLHLDEAKLEKFIVIIHDELEKHEPPTSLDMSYNSLMHIAKIKDQQLEGILNEAQMTRWKVILGPYRNAGMWGVDVEESLEEDSELEETEEAESAEGDDG